jgi:apolipoprotein N-acyltransferase
MTTQMLSESRMNPQPGDATHVLQPAGSHPVVLALSSALLLWFAFPPAGWGWLAWIALTPLFLLIRSERRASTIYLSAWLGGLAFWLMAIRWVRLADPDALLGWILMGVALSVWWPLFVFLTRLAVRRLALPLMLAAPVVWVGLEFARAFYLTGFPWYYLAHSQYLFLPVIQVADLAGALGISVLVAMANACWADLLTLPLFQPTPQGSRLVRRRVVGISVLVIGLVATLVYGAFRLGTAEFRMGPRLALLQSNIPQQQDPKPEPLAVLRIYEMLVEKALRLKERPDLIVWPETSYPFGVVAMDPAVLNDPALFEKQARKITPERGASFWLEKWRDVEAHLHGWTDRIQVPMLVGSLTYDFAPEGPSKFNSAILVEPGRATTQSYHKLHLVPFGEYVPLVETFPWLTRLTPYHGDHVPNLTFGRVPRWIDFGRWRIATAICFEDTLAHTVRRFFAEVEDGHQPDLLLNLSNDGWFQGSEELDVHLAASVFRAVENRVPLARAVNTGLSALIDGNGRIVASLAKLEEGVLAVRVPLDDRVSLYSRWGDWVGLACLAICIGLIPMSLFRSLVLR